MDPAICATVKHIFYMRVLITLEAIAFFESSCFLYKSVPNGNIARCDHLKVALSKPGYLD